MKSNLHPQRCHHGRRGKMAPSNQQEDEEAGEGAMNIPHTEDEEAMNSKQEEEVDAAATTTVAGRGGGRGNKHQGGWTDGGSGGVLTAN